MSGGRVVAAAAAEALHGHIRHSVAGGLHANHRNKHTRVPIHAYSHMNQHLEQVVLLLVLSRNIE